MRFTSGFAQAYGSDVMAFGTVLFGGLKPTAFTLFRLPAVEAVALGF